MANPNYGVSVNIQGIKTEQQNAIRNASKQNSFLTKRVNRWCNSASSFINIQKWMDCGDSKLTPEMFEGKKCWIGIDLSSRIDITAVVKLFKVDNTFYVFPKFYLPSERALDPSLGMYSKWVQQGYLTPTEGNCIDMDQVMVDVFADIDRYKPTEICFDKWHADLYQQTIGKEYPSLSLVDIPMDVKNLSPAMFELEALILDKNIKHSNNPVLTWMASNLQAKVDVKGNVYPRKAKDENKIDGILALLVAMARARLQAQPSAPIMFFA